jgi:hypothetical protein
MDSSGRRSVGRVRVAAGARWVGLLVLVLAWLTFCGAGATVLWGFYQFREQLNYDCNRHPPLKTFRRMLGERPPGVWDVRATGYIGLGGSDVRLRFTASDAAIARLTRDYERLGAADAEARVRSLASDAGTGFLEVRSGSPSQHQVHWEALERIRNAEVYQKPQAHPGSEDTLVVDRERRLVYFYHWNQ